jgi:hypothetical protein
MTCGIIANWNCPLVGGLAASTTVLIDLYSGIDATSTLLWDYAAQETV